MTEVYAEMRKDFQVSVPQPIREAVEKLLGDPLALAICRVLYRTPTNVHMTQPDLIKNIEKFIEENQIGYRQIIQTLQVLHEEGFVYIQERSMPDHFLTNKSVEAMEIIDVIDGQIVTPFIEEIQKKGFKYAEIEKQIRNDVYSALK
jgi:hypothetical protein